MSENAKNMVCFRLAPEVRAALDDYCLAHGLKITDLYRSLTVMLLEGQVTPGSIEGFKSARSMAIQLAQILLATAAESLPNTLEEAQARYGFAG